MVKISELMQAHRSKNIAIYKSQLDRLEEKNFQSSKDEKKIDNLKGRIARNEELNKIARNNANTKSQIQIAKASATKIDNSHKEVNYTDNRKKGLNDNHVEVGSNNQKIAQPTPKNPTDNKGSKKPTTKTTTEKKTKKK